MTSDYIRLIRPKHWIKNLFVFAPLVFSYNFRNQQYVWNSIITFVSFCAAASSVYILNDIIDRKRDRDHPDKRNRPIAAGRISIVKASIISLLLLTASISIAYPLNMKVMLTIGTYILLNIAYTVYLDRLIIIDVMAIAFGFLLRLQAGAFAISVGLSHWILITTFFLSLFLGFGKRRREVINIENHEKGVDRTHQYSSNVLDSFITISAAITIISYSLYAIGTDHLIFTVPFVVFGIFRYHHLVYMKNRNGDPTDCLLNDKILIIDILLWCVISTIVIIVAEGHVVR